jgi:hypothetical protein
MFATLIFGMQVVVNLLLYSLVARWYIQPRLKQLPLVAALTPLLLFQYCEQWAPPSSFRVSSHCVA